MVLQSIITLFFQYDIFFQKKAFHKTIYLLTSKRYLHRMYNDQGYCKPFVSSESELTPNSKALITPMHLYWDINHELEKNINDAFSFCLKVFFYFLLGALYVFILNKIIFLFCLANENIRNLYLHHVFCVLCFVM